MSSWRYTTLDEFITVKHGFAFKGEYFSESGTYVVLTPGNFHEEGGFKLRPGKDRYYRGEIPKDYILKKGDMIVAMTEQAEGLLGCPAIIPDDDIFLHNQRLGLVNVKPNKADVRFLYFMMNTSSVRQQIRGSSSGTKIRHTSPERIRNVKVYAPEYRVQRKIAAVLSAYDDLIENNKHRISLLEKMAEEIYREWFVRLRFPGHEKVKVVKGVPEGWEKKRFSDFCTLQRGYDLPESQVEPGSYPVVASTSIKTYHKHFKVKPPVITTGRSGSLGTVLFVNENAWPLNTSLYVKNFHGNSCYLVYYTLKSMGLENFNAGAGVPSLNRNHLNGITLAVPPGSLQGRFDAIIAPLFQQKEQLARANEVLGKTRDTLLPRLISGKLSVENLDIQFPPGMEA